MVSPATATVVLWYLATLVGRLSAAVTHASFSQQAEVSGRIICVVVL